MVFPRGRFFSRAFLTAAACCVVLSSHAVAQAVNGEPQVVTYKTVDGVGLSLSILKPKGEEGHAVPAIIFFHGGGWIAGGMHGFDQQAAYFSARGLVTVQVEYRLLKPTDNDPPKICAEDAKSYVRWVRAHAKELGVDPDRIVEAGVPRADIWRPLPRWFRVGTILRMT